MLFSEQDLVSYREDGFVLVPDLFSREEVGVMHQEMEKLAEPGRPGVVLETNGLIRALHGSHEDSPVFADLVRQGRLLDPAVQILDSSVYIHQFKINVKAAFGGDVWPWHQDFIFWSKEDGVPEDRLINAAIFLDDVNEFNGPLYFIPGSHQAGMIDVPADGEAGMGWEANVSARLKFTVPRERVASMVAKQGCVSPKGSAGSVLFFHPNLVHGSVPNISPYDRRLAIVTYNSTANIPTPLANPRPAFLVGRDYRPLERACTEAELVDVG